VAAGQRHRQGADDRQRAAGDHRRADQLRPRSHRRPDLLDQHHLAKRAKDIGSAAVFVALVNAAAVWGLVLFA
jgi:hypothetical protein